MPAVKVRLPKRQLPELLLYGMMSAGVLAALAYSLPSVPVESKADTRRMPRSELLLAAATPLRSMRIVGLTGLRAAL